MRNIHKIFALITFALLPSLSTRAGGDANLFVRLSSGDSLPSLMSTRPVVSFTNDRLLVTEKTSGTTRIDELLSSVSRIVISPKIVAGSSSSAGEETGGLPVCSPVAYHLDYGLTGENVPFDDGQSVQPVEEQIAISDATITLEKEEYQYIGSAVEPVVTVTYSGAALVKGTDYTVTYNNNEQAGTATIIITGIGKYTGSVNRTFKIVKIQTVDVVINGEHYDAVMNNTQARYNTELGDVVILDCFTLPGETTTVYVLPKNGWSASKDSITPKLQGDDPANLQTYRKYELTVPATGTVTVDVTFFKNNSILPAKVTLSETSFAYAGKPVGPDVTVSLEGTALVAGTDYDVTLVNNTNAGTAKLTITGKNSYEGTIDTTFVINKAKLTVTADSVQRAYGEANPQLTYSIVGFVNGETADTLTTQPKATTVAKADSPLGQYDITVAGGASQNYEFEYVPAKLTVVAADISSADIAITATEPFVYTGDSIMPAFTARLGATPLTADTDFKAVFTDNVKAGEAVLTLTGQGNYEGTVTTTFTIGKAMLTVTAQDSSMVYGDALPEPTYEVTGFVGDEDASVLTAAPVVSTEATSASRVGKYAITATGGEAANYDFTYVDGVLTVGPRSIDDATLTLAADSVAYTGKALEPELTIVLGTVELTAGTDYSVEYRNNTETGIASIMVMGLGNYEGWKTASFTVYLRPALAVTINGETIKPDVDELLSNSAPATFRADQGEIMVDNYYAMPGSIVVLNVTPNKEGYYYITREDIEGVELIGSEPEDSSAVRSYRFIVPESGTVDLKATFTYDEVAAGILDSYVTDLRFEVVDGGKAVRVTGADEGAPVSVFDARGQQVAADVVRSVRELIVRLSHQPQGLYIIKVNNKSFKVYRK